VIGAGDAGLRSAVELAAAGAVLVLAKRELNSLPEETLAFVDSPL
jgi:thioredoxin reductase